MRKFAAVVTVLAIIWLVEPGAIGGLLILALPVVLLRGVWLFSGDLKRIGRPRR